MYFFLGPTPEDATRQYTAAIGRHEVPAYWSLGFHLCRWGYNNTESMAAAHQRMRDAGIPQDGQVQIQPAPNVPIRNKRQIMCIFSGATLTSWTGG